MVDKTKEELLAEIIDQPKLSLKRCMICRKVLIAGQMVHESALGVSASTPYDWPSATLNDGFCGAECMKVYRRDYCSAGKGK